MELGLIQMIVNNKIEAKKYFKKALKYFGGYTTESLVKIRINSALNQLDSNVDNEDKNHLNVNLSEFSNLKIILIEFIDDFCSCSR